MIRVTCQKAMIILVMISLLVTACGQADQGEEPNQPEQPGGAEETEELSGELSVMVPGGGYYVEHVRDFVAKEFTQRHPNVRVSVEQEPEGGSLTARFAAGDIPDVIIGVFGYQPARYAREDIIVDLSNMQGAEELFDRISPQYIHEDYGGRYYVPWNATTQMMIYNKELFREAGLDPENPPATFDEYLAAAETINNLPDRPDGSRVYGNLFWNEALAWGGWYWTMKSQIYYNFNDGNYRLFNQLGTDIVFDQPEANMVEFMEFMNRAQEFAPDNMENNEFFTRNIGMWLQFGYGWKANLQEAKDQPMVIGEDVGIAPIPTNGDTHWSTLDGRSLMVGKSNPEREQLAFEFIKFMMEDEINLESLKKLEQLPTLTALEEDEYFDAPDIRPFVEQLEHTIPNEAVAELDDVSNIILQNYIKSIIRGEMSPQQAVEESAEEARKVLQ